jgi:hypothetical protein
LHPLSPQMQFCLLLCLLFWSSFDACAVVVRKAKMLLPLLLDSVLDCAHACSSISFL